MTPTLSPSLDVIQPSAIRELANLAFAMEDVKALHFGESDMPTPGYIGDALAQAVLDGYTFYSPNAGLTSLRTALAAKAAELHGVNLDPIGEIVVTASGSQALNVVVRCALGAGDEALILTPNWPNGTAVVSLYGGRPIEIPMIATPERFVIDFDALEAAVSPRTRLLIYTSPSNPLGWVATLEEQQALLDFARRHNLWLLADEVYERLYYQGPVAPSILRLCTRDDAVIVLQSFSKAYRMTGWRLGWAVARGDLAHKAGQLNEFVISNAPSMIQRAGEAALALGEDDLAAMVELFGERMSFCYEALSSMQGVRVPRSEGAFYLFPKIEGVENSYDFAVDLLKTEKVAVAPGSAFGNGGEGSVRICCASDFSVLEPAMERLERFLRRR
jgi:aspartate/methionine/tyrosine aminotransferase